MNRQAIRRIVLAQIASDGGKGITDLLDVVPENLRSSALKAWDAGYAVKDKLLEQAAQIVARHHDKDIRFFVTADKQKVAKYIVYFDFRFEGKRWQASFHSFGDFWSKWEEVSVSSRGHWDRKSSRETCEKLLAVL